MKKQVKETLTVFGIGLLTGMIISYILPILADHKGRVATKYLQICSEKRIQQRKLIKCYKDNNSCTSLKRHYFGEIK